jgi:hypothetical protein
MTDLNDWPLWLVAVAVLVLGVGRLVRIITYDDFPPSAWARSVWDTITNDGPWSKLAHCFWCLTPWVMLGAMAWYWVGTMVPWINVAWWIFWGWLALSYLASMIIARDEPDGEE